jgi:hypothetical protein
VYGSVANLFLIPENFAKKNFMSHYIYKKVGSRAMSVFIVKWKWGERDSFLTIRASVANSTIVVDEVYATARTKSSHSQILEVFGTE